MSALIAVWVAVLATFAAWMVLAVAAHAAPPPGALKDVTATQVSPTVLEVRVRLDATVKRARRVNVHAEACAVPEPGWLLCSNDAGVDRKVRLHRGRNRRTVVLTVRHWVSVFVGVASTGTLWDGDRLVPGAADVAFVGLGRSGPLREVAPSVADASRETLVQGGTS